MSNKPTPHTKTVEDWIEEFDRRFDDSFYKAVVKQASSAIMIPNVFHEVVNREAKIIIKQALTEHGENIRREQIEKDARIAFGIMSVYKDENIMSAINGVGFEIRNQNNSQ